MSQTAITTVIYVAIHRIEETGECIVHVLLKGNFRFVFWDHEEGYKLSTRLKEGDRLVIEYEDVTSEKLPGEATEYFQYHGVTFKDVKKG